MQMYKWLDNVFIRKGVGWRSNNYCNCICMAHSGSILSTMSHCIITFHTVNTLGMRASIASWVFTLAFFMQERF